MAASGGSLPGTGAASPPSSPLSCPPTPEHLPPGSLTPPPSFRLNKKAVKRKSRSLDGRSSPDTEATCPICLGELDNKSMTNTCMHKFCFTCLLEWSKVKAVCPLCKGNFTSIIHNVRSYDSAGEIKDCDKYELPPAEPQPEPGNPQEFLFQTRRFRYHTDLDAERRGRRATTALVARPQHIWRRQRGPGTTDFRRTVYSEGMRAEEDGGEAGRVRDCSPAWYRTNEAQTHRLVPWLNRELNVLLEHSGQHSQLAFLLQQIMDWVKHYNISSPEMRDLLQPYLGIRTEHFQHEFHHFARHPCDITGWDRSVRYASRPATEVVSSDSEEGPGGPGGRYLDELRNRMHMLRDSAARVHRALEGPSLGLGVTEYPDRGPRPQRGFRREMDRFWGLRGRVAPGDEGEGRRRKSRAPARRERGLPGGLQESAMDLSLGQPSTSQGHNSGLTRLVIPDTDSGDSGGEAPLVVDGSPAASPVREILQDVVSLAVEPSQAVAASLHPASYTAAHTQLGFLTDLTGLLPPDASLHTPPPPDAPAIEAEENSDLEVVDVIEAKTRKARDPVVVELSDTESSDQEQNRAISEELRRQAETGVIPFPVFNQDEPVVISSDEDEEVALPEPSSWQEFHNYSQSISSGSLRMRLNTLQRGCSALGGGGELGNSSRASRRETVPPSHPDSSSDDDLIVVKTEHNTIDPITKREIVEPVRNKKCNHIYEKSTIYSMIDLARENSKPVKCPYMGCNCRDFKKTDLVKDKEVLGHLNTIRDERERAQTEQREKDRKAAEERRKRRNGGNESDKSADSIVEEVIEMIRSDQNSSHIEIPGISEPKLSESSTDETASKTEISNTSSDRTNTVNNEPDAGINSSVEPEKSKNISKTAKYSRASRKSNKRKSQHRLSESQSSDSDAPLSKAVFKKKRNPIEGLVPAEGQEICAETIQRTVRKGKKSVKNIKILGKKVTETWCIEKARKRKKKSEQKAQNGNSGDEEDSDSDEEDSVSKKGKSSRSKPPKNKTRPKRSKNPTSYEELEEDF